MSTKFSLPPAEKRAERVSFILILFLILAFLLRFVHFISHQPTYREGQEIDLIITLTSQPQVYQKSQRFEIGGVAIITSVFPEYSYGDKLKISGTLKNGVLIFPKIEVIEKGKGTLILRKIFALRERLTFLFESFLPEPAASLLLGIFLGVKSALPARFYLALRKTGVLHVVVASGMNATMVASFVLTLFNLVLKRRWAALLTILAVLFYTALSGFEPPILRAAIMGTLALLGHFFGRLNFGVLSLFLAGYLMTFKNPDLVTDLGFQLSFASTAGLILIRPLLQSEKGLWRKMVSLPVLGPDLTTTISAQLATLPIILANFGQYQCLSLLVNTLVLWTTPILMAFGGVVALLGVVFPPLGQAAAFLALPFLFYFEKIVVFFAQFSFAEIGVGKLPFVLTLGYYLLLTSALVFCYKKRGVKFL